MSLSGKTATTTTESLPAVGIYPAISVQGFVDGYRLPEVYSPQLIVKQLKYASRLVQDHLRDVVVGTDELTDEQKELYADAVQEYARSELIRYYETVNRKSAAEVQGERGDELVNHWEARAHRLTDLLAKSLEANNWQNTNGTRVVLL
jgi:hypothetical protein